MSRIDRGSIADYRASPPREDQDNWGVLSEKRRSDPDLDVPLGGSRDRTDESLKRKRIASKENLHGKQMQRGKEENKVRCKYFNSKAGCSRGDSCKFLHERKKDKGYDLDRERKKPRREEYDRSVNSRPTTFSALAEVYAVRNFAIFCDRDLLSHTIFQAREDKLDDRSRRDYTSSDSQARRTDHRDRYDEDPRERGEKQKEGAADFLSTLPLDHDPNQNNDARSRHTSSTHSNDLERKIKSEPVAGSDPASSDAILAVHDRFREVEQQVKNLSAKMKQEHELREQIEKKNRHLAGKNDELEKRISELEKEKRGWEDTRGGMQKKISELGADNDLLREKCKALTEMMQKYEKEAESLAKAKEEQEKKMNERGMRESALAARNKQAVEKLKDANEATKRLQKDLSDMTDRNAKLRQLLLATKAEKDKLAAGANQQQQKEGGQKDGGEAATGEEATTTQQVGAMTDTGEGILFQDEVRARLMALERRVLQLEGVKAEEEEPSSTRSTQETNRLQESSVLKDTNASIEDLENEEDEFVEWL